MTDKSAKKNRRDHYLPQGYLRGFIDPTRAKLPKPLWCFNIPSKRWREVSPKEIGYIDGFYDYATDVPDAEHPDLTFKQLENDFPRVRAKILSEGFKTWAGQKEFLLAYMQMIRARSPLFFDQWREHASKMRVARVTEVLPGNRAVKVDSNYGRPMTQGEIQTWTIARMREEIRKGPDWLGNFDWALRYTENPSDPVIATETSFVLIGVKQHESTDAALSDPDTLVCFPLCWQACLLGSLRRFDVETDKFDPETLKFIRQPYIQHGRQFIISPQRLPSF